MRVLHHYPLSPSSRMIRLYLEEKKIEFVTKLEIFWERNETFLKKTKDTNLLPGAWLIYGRDRKLHFYLQRLKEENFI